MTIFWARANILVKYGFWGAHFLDPYKLRSVFPLLQLGGWIYYILIKFQCCRSIPPAVPSVLDSRCTSRSSRAFTAAGPVKVTKPSSQPAAMTWRSAKDRLASKLLQNGDLPELNPTLPMEMVYLPTWIALIFMVNL